MEGMKIHFVLRKRDADIVYWKSTLPKRTFNFYVTSILSAERKSQIAVVPIPKERGLLQEETELSIYIKEKRLITFMSKISKGRRSDYIKRVIRKHIEVNYSRNEQENSYQNNPKSQVEANEPMAEETDKKRENFLRMIGN